MHVGKTRREILFLQHRVGDREDLDRQQPGTGYLRTACNYVHLNPVRDRMLNASLMLPFRSSRRQALIRSSARISRIVANKGPDQSLLASSATQPAPPITAADSSRPPARAASPPLGGPGAAEVATAGLAGGRTGAAAQGGLGEGVNRVAVAPGEYGELEMDGLSLRFQRGRWSLRRR